MLLSIVIANYNYGRFLEAAINSVLKQMDGLEGKVELIVVDGGSKDESVEIIKRYADKLAWWVSEPDKGQSDAFNKGFAHSSGKYLTWLNADDLLVDGALAKIVAAFEAYPECEWFTGNFFRFTQDGKVIQIGWGPHWYPGFLQLKSSPLVVFGPTTFFSRKIYEAAGKIDEEMHYVMDTDLWVKFIMAGVKQRRINCFCWAFRMHEDSKTAEFGEHTLDDARMKRLNAEEHKAYERAGYRPSKFMRRVCQLFRLVDGSYLKFRALRKGFTRFEYDGGSR